MRRAELHPPARRGASELDLGPDGIPAHLRTESRKAHALAVAALILAVLIATLA